MDMDAFFVSVELRRRPDLAGQAGRRRRNRQPWRGRRSLVRGAAVRRALGDAAAVPCSAVPACGVPAGDHGSTARSARRSARSSIATRRWSSRCRSTRRSSTSRARSGCSAGDGHRRIDPAGVPRRARPRLFASAWHRTSSSPSWPPSKPNHVRRRRRSTPGRVSSSSPLAGARVPRPAAGPTPVGSRAGHARQAAPHRRPPRGDLSPSTARRCRRRSARPRPTTWRTGTGRTIGRSNRHAKRSRSATRRRSRRTRISLTRCDPARPTCRRRGVAATQGRRRCAHPDTQGPVRRRIPHDHPLDHGRRAGRPGPTIVALLQPIVDSIDPSPGVRLVGVSGSNLAAVHHQLTFDEAVRRRSRLRCP